jgi:hypothetical protein
VADALLNSGDEEIRKLLDCRKGNEAWTAAAKWPRRPALARLSRSISRLRSRTQRDTRRLVSVGSTPSGATPTGGVKILSRHALRTYPVATVLEREPGTLRPCGPPCSERSARAPPTQVGLRRISDGARRGESCDPGAGKESESREGPKSRGEGAGWTHPLRCGGSGGRLAMGRRLFCTSFCHRTSHKTSRRVSPLNPRVASPGRRWEAWDRTHPCQEGGIRLASPAGILVRPGARGATQVE